MSYPRPCLVMEGMVKTLGIAAGLLGMAAIAAIAMSTPASPAASALPLILSATSTPALSLPKAVTKPATEVATTTADLEGIVSPNGLLTTYWFEYSADPQLGQVLNRSTPRIALSTTTGSVPVAISAVNLMPSTIYYFRLVAESAAGIVRAQPLSLLTK